MTIVVGVDGSAQSIAALDRAVVLATALSADLHVVYCSYVTPMLMSAMEGAASVLADTTDRQREAAWNAVDPVLAELDTVHVERVELKGYPPDALVAYADEHDAELLIVGSRGHGAVASLLLGSTSHRVLNTANCDVMVVKAREA